MRVQFENVDFSSSSGPNGFGLKLARQFQLAGIKLTNDRPDVRLSFIQSVCNFSPTVLRLDGIYFNSAQDWERLNEQIKRSYDFASAVIVQSEFNKQLTEHYFGKRENVHVVHNGTDLKAISSIPAAKFEDISCNTEVWFCASSWRPHKRLADNIRYFYDNAPKEAILLVAGNNPDVDISNKERVFYIGTLGWQQLISVMKRSSTFIHLSWLDHCPNVVIDARACGCRIICSSAGGTKEIAGENSMIIKEEEWDYSPIELYTPPKMKWQEESGKNISSILDIIEVEKKYRAILEMASGIN